MLYLISKYFGTSVLRVVLLLIAAGCFGFLGYLVANNMAIVGVVSLAIAGVWFLYLAFTPRKKETTVNDGDGESYHNRGGGVTNPYDSETYLSAPSIRYPHIAVIRR